MTVMAWWKSRMRPKAVKYGGAAAALAIGAIAGYAIGIKYASLAAPIPVEVRSNSDNYPFINPFLYVSTNKSLYTAEFSGLVGSLDAYIQSVKADHAASDVSFYFRDMNNEHWTGINENDAYQPSSMLKVVTLIAASRLVETSEPDLFDRKLHYERTDEDGQYYKPSDGYMQTGYYTVRDLLKAMIMYSDNDANAALLADKEIDDEFTDVYKLFRLPAATSTDADFMSAKSYSVIWRTLYNSTLLSNETSDQILNLLTYTDFNDGLVAGLPTGTTVAHKFGEHSDGLSAIVPNLELHDCGIVYYPGRPYFICVMTKGADFPSLANVIAGISKIVYQYVAGSMAVPSR